MKRKVKLFATIASLCLSLALMAFGVYAATSITFTSKGTVNYTLADDVWTSFTVSAQQYAYKDAVVANAAAVDALELPAATTVDLNGDAEGTTYFWDAAQDAAKTDAEMSHTKEGLFAVNFNEGYIYEITISVARTNGAADATVTSTIKDVTADSGYAVVLATGVEAEQELPADSTAITFTYYVLLTDNMAAITDLPFTLELVVAVA